MSKKLFAIRRWGMKTCGKLGVSFWDVSTLERLAASAASRFAVLARFWPDLADDRSMKPSAPQIGMVCARAPVLLVAISQGLIADHQ